MALLILDGSGPGVVAALEPGASIRVHRAGELAGAVQQLLDVSGLRAADLELVAGLIGPGSFTGLRAALALGHGIAAGAAVTLVAVAAAEAFAAMHPGRALLCAFSTGRTGRVAVQPVAIDGTCGRPRAIDVGELGELRSNPSALPVGPEAALLATALGRGAGPAAPAQPAIAAAARRRLAGSLAPLAPVPLYVDDLFG